MTLFKRDGPRVIQSKQYCIESKTAKVIAAVPRDLR